MSKVDRCSFRLFEKGDAGNESFVGSGFVVRDTDQTLLVTAAHVAFENDSKPRSIVARQYDGNTVIDNINFQQHGLRDIASARVEEMGETLDFGFSDDVINGDDLRIRPVYCRGERPEYTVDVVEIGGIPKDRRGNKPMDPKYDSTFEYVSKDGSQPVWPGCSGSPIVDSQEKVVGVHVRGGWKDGLRRNIAHIFTSDRK